MIEKIMEFIDSDFTYFNMVIDIRGFYIHSYYVDNEEYILSNKHSNCSISRKNIDDSSINIIDKSTIDIIDSNIDISIHHSMSYTKETLLSANVNFITHLICDGLSACYRKTFSHICGLVSSGVFEFMNKDEVVLFMKDRYKEGVSKRYRAILSRGDYFRMKIEYSGIMDSWFHKNFLMTPIYSNLIESLGDGFIFGRLDTIDFIDYNTAIFELTKIANNCIKMDVSNVFDINTNNTTFTRFI